MRTNTSQLILQESLKAVNESHGYKLEFNRFEKIGKWIHFTIQSESSGIPGARYSHSGRKLKSASWHAHGFLFDEIFNRDHLAIVWSAGKKITKEGGNWKDVNIGSIVNPVMFSQTSIH